ncbi:MAG: 2-isopropylmalate synthase [Planctomycetota bacterium]|nr:MAG: 2-isopropylmalate synthase [Planctomycetota bacterium]
MDNRIIIFDTTLRDGEQSPGASMNTEEKLQIAKHLARMKVDVIEAGFPIASQGDFEAVTAVAETVKGVTICGLCRSLNKDIDRAVEALKNAEKPRLHVFLATSKIHLEYKLKMAEDKILETAVNAVKYAKSFYNDVEFSPEDASRTEPSFLAKVTEAVIDAGATTVNIPDTVGYTTPEEFYNLITYLYKNVKNINQAVISVHCHNDLGLAVANSLAAIRAGARQVECTVNGIGERAGNCAMEEFIMAAKTRKDIYDYQIDLDTTKIYPISTLVSKITGIFVQRNKAIVGQNAFAHEAGIHQHGYLANKETYEIMTPESVGIKEATLVLGKHSGRHAFQKHMEDLGFSLTEEKLNATFKAFKDLADKKKEVYDDDLISLIETELGTVAGGYEIENIQIQTGNNIRPVACVKIKKDGEFFEDASIGDGPVDAACQAIKRIIGIDCNLEDYRLHSSTSGMDAIGEVSTIITDGKYHITGKASDTDVIIASAKSFLNAVNRLINIKEQNKKD